MGLLDLLAPSSDGGGLLDFLKRNAAASIANAPGGLPSDQAQYAPMPAMQPVSAQPIASGNQPSPLDGAAWPYGPVGAPSQANASMQPPIPQQPPPVISAPPVVAPQPIASPVSSGIGDRFSAAGRGALANMQNGPLGMLFGGIAGLAGMGQATPQQIQAQTANLTAKMLIAKGVDPQVAIAAVQPGNAEALKQLITTTLGPHNVQSLGQGYVYDPIAQKTTRAYEPDDQNKVVQIGQDAMGGKQFGVFNPSDGTIKPYTAPGANSGGIGDMNKTGAEYLATVPKQQAGILQGMVDGTIQPPSSFALAKPYWQTMLAAAKNLDPNFDANTWAARHKMFTDLASSGNSSMGGILSNGKSSFAHLADLSGSMADLGNASHNYPGGGAVATTENYLGNKVFAGSDTLAKIKAINDNLGHYGQESTKFYSGTGGGAEERMNALKEMNPTTTSSAEMAAYLAKEKSLMTDRLREKESQIRDTMGDAFLQKHPVFTPQLQQTMNAIDANIAKLRGQPAQAAPAPLQPGQSTSINGVSIKRVN